MIYWLNFLLLAYAVFSILVNSGLFLDTKSPQSNSDNGIYCIAWYFSAEGVNTIFHSERFNYTFLQIICTFLMQVIFRCRPKKLLTSASHLTSPPSFQESFLIK